MAEVLSVEGKEKERRRERPQRVDYIGFEERIYYSNF
jgi:hypothetical protein